MANIGRKILSAFVEVQEEEKRSPSTPAIPEGTIQVTPPENEKFRSYFEKLFSEANLPGPDYYEFSKMVEAMKSIPEERDRFCAAFAGLQVQGLTKEQLLGTAAQYLQVLDDDAKNFSATIDTALEQKVQSRKQEIANKQQRLQQLTREISDITAEIAQLSGEVKESEEKIRTNSEGYQQQLAVTKQRIAENIEKIKQHIH